MRDRLLFLDFDGVIIYWLGTVPNPSPLWEKALGHKAICSIDRTLARNVSRFCAEIGAQVVLSTAWRGSTAESLDQLRHALWSCGMEAPVVGQTPHLGTDRGEEIDRWLKANRPGMTRDQIVILDDHNDMEPYLDRLVLCDYRKGFTEEEMELGLSLFH